MSWMIVLGILFLNVAICEILVKRTALRHFGTALLVIILTAIEANLGLIPSASDSIPLYDHIFVYIAPLSIFYLLLEINLKSLKQAGIPMLVMFLVGSFATLVGVYIGGIIAGGSENIGEFFPYLAGMFAGTYTGGSINFNAVALAYDITKEGNVYAASVAIDNIITAFWMVATIALPKLLKKYFPQGKPKNIIATKVNEKDLLDLEKVDPLQLSILIAMGMFALWSSEEITNLIKSTFGWSIPSILTLTTISLVLAQIPAIKNLSGSRVLGVLGIYLFLAVIGAFCEFATIPQIGSLAIYILIFASVMVLVHGLVVFALGKLLKMDWDVVWIASQANVGGSGSALALARSLDRHDLLLPSILVGTLGNALGTYLGFLMVGLYQ